MATWFRRAVAIALTLGVAFVLLLPSAPGPGAALPHADKLVHAALFLLLGLAWRLAWPGVSARALVVMLVGYGGLTEALQALLPARSADVWDLLADSAGAAAGVALARSRAR